MPQFLLWKTKIEIVIANTTFDSDVRAATGHNDEDSSSKTPTFFAPIGAARLEGYAVATRYVKVKCLCA